MRPEWLADFLSSSLGSLLAMNKHTYRYGVVLHERIGIIRISVEDMVVRELDLDAILADLSWDDPGEPNGHI